MLGDRGKRAKVEAVIKDDPEALAMFREAMKEHAGRPTKESTNNVSTIQDEGRNTEHGNSRAYSIDRVKRECDEATVKQVMSGELSPNAALVKAGTKHLNCEKSRFTNSDFYCIGLLDPAEYRCVPKNLDPKT